MDREIVEQKLESLRRCLKRIETKCPPDPETLLADYVAQQLAAAAAWLATGVGTTRQHGRPG